MSRTGLELLMSSAAAVVVDTDQLAPLSPLEDVVVRLLDSVIVVSTTVPN